MCKIHRLLWAAAVILLLPGGVAGQATLRWQPTLEGAKRLAAQTNRLVLIHFWAEWCQACQEMDRDVFSQSSVASAVASHYVPVKINARYFPTTCQQYGVTVLPTDIIITPQGQQVDRLRGPLGASEYVARLNQVAAAGRPGGSETYAQVPSGQKAPGQAYPPASAAGYRAPDGQPQPDPRYAELDSRQRAGQGAAGYAPNSRPPGDARVGQQPQAAQPVTAQQQQPWQGTASSAVGGPALQRPSGGPVAGNPPLGLDGYCPVQLSDDMKANVLRWTLGDRRWGAIHRGRTYLFAGPEQQRKFLADPDRYAPVLSGNDVVIALEQQQTVPGHRRHGVLFGSRVYLFANETTLARFSKDPRRYARQVLQTLQAEADQKRQLRR